jgi:hypothetical protein
MKLYDVTHKPRWVDPAKAENFEGLVKCREVLPKQTWEKMIRTVDHAIDKALNTTGKVVWTRAAALFGRGSKQPHADVDHLWSSLEKAVGDGVPILKTLGALLRWRISVRDEEYWLAYTTETEKWDDVEQRYVAYTEYFISDKFVPPDRPTGKIKLDGLAQSWGARIN